MASVVNVNQRAQPQAAPEWARRYPPLATLLIALAIAIIVLPSSLNQPQANPSSTVELAPVPPTDDEPPPQGNINQLGLGTSSGVESAGAQGEGEGGLPPPATGGGVKRSLQTKRCVGNPKRQTEDPLSPPCVAFFEGDNGGATYQGVTRDEVKIVFYEDGASFYTPTARGTDNMPTNRLIDLDLPPEPNEVGQFFTRRAWAKYFEERWQTFGRRPHFYIYYGAADGSTEARQADAAQVYGAVKPFATISSTGLSGGSDDFLTFMAERGVLNFGSLSGRAEGFFNGFPKLIWGYPPSVEQMGRNYISVICKKLVNQPVSFGDVGRGSARRFGLLYTNDRTYPSLQRLASLVEKGVKDCGANVVAKATFPANGFYLDTVTPPQYASQNMQAFQNAGVTTILWAGGVETKMSGAAATLGYRPEWFALGDGLQEAVSYGAVQDQTVWRNAWVATPTVAVVPLHEQVCYQAYREVDQIAVDSDVQGFACEDYNNLRQLFTGIQVAGPKLGPFSIDKGMHAIPAVDSPDPRLPACFYDVSDYTCVKDMQLMWWDPGAVAPGSDDVGCYKMAQSGKRYRTGKWPDGNVSASKTSSDPCNTYDATQYINNV